MLSRAAIRPEGRNPGGITIRVEMAPPAKNTAQSIFSEKHPDYAKVVALQQAARDALDGLPPFTHVPLRMEIHVGRAQCRADGLNLINGVADVLQRRSNLSYGKPNWVFDDDANIKAFQYSESPADTDWYELTITPIDARHRT